MLCCNVLNIKQPKNQSEHPNATTWHCDDGIYVSKQPSRVLQKMWNSVFKTRISLWINNTSLSWHDIFFALFSVSFLHPARCRPRHTPKHCSHNRLCLTESSIVPHSRHRHYRSQWRCASRGQKPDTCCFSYSRDSVRQYPSPVVTHDSFLSVQLLSSLLSFSQSAIFSN